MTRGVSQPSVSSTPASPLGAKEAALGTLATAGVMVRWLLPTEGVASGDQLWLAAAWSLLAGLWLGWSRMPRRPFGWLDGFLTLCLCGHLLGGVAVFWNGGHARIAANLIGEWWGMACGWIVLRDWLRDEGWARSLRRGLLAMATTMAVLGLWQHYWSLPQTARELLPKIERIRMEQARGETGPTAWEFLRMGLPTTEPGLTLFEKRLGHSREPFALFALANTLGGLLAACLVWGGTAAAWSPARAAGILRYWARWLPSLVLVAWCLALTKSRTAWVGTLMGVLVSTLLALRPHDRLPWSAGLKCSTSAAWKRCGAGLLMAGLLLAGGVWLLWRSGAWDREVFAEAPKSLTYRGQYWWGALRLIAESPWWGIGLGQFREHYLRVKLPAASEEIADPHNLLLDAWVNGGLCGVVGLLGTVAATVWTFRTRSANPQEREAASANTGCSAVVGMGGLLGFGLAFVTGLLLRGEWDDQLWLLGLLWAGLFVLLPSAPTDEPVAAAVPLVVLGIHLLGAGGMGMPAVVLAALVWLSIATAGSLPRPIWGPRGWRSTWLGSGLCLAAAIVIAVGVWRPVVVAAADMEEGDRAAERGDWVAALAAYQRAMDGDRWDPLPAGRLAEAAFEQGKALLPSDPHYASATEGPFAVALAALAEARRRHPQSTVWLQREAELWLVLADRQGDVQPARQAQMLLEQAVERYPTQTSLLVLWSDAAAAAGDRSAAGAAARRALAQDDLNRRLGHVERILPDPVRKRMETRGASMAPSVPEGP